MATPLAALQPEIAAVAPAESPAPLPHESALVLFNEKAGGVTAIDRQRLLELLVSKGVRKFEVTETDRLGPKTFEMAKGHDLFIVLGGDGTARCAAEHAPAGAPPLVLLPGGTLNILPRALYGDLAWPEALTAALERGKVRRLSLGRANGAPFFVAAMFGESTMLATAREAVREGKYLRAVRRARHVAKKSLTHSLRARPDNGRMHKAEAVGVLCPSFAGAPEGDHLEWARLDATSMLDLVRLGFKSMGPGWRDDPAIDLRECRSGDIVSLGLIPATLDGEPKTFVNRVSITFEPSGPSVIALDL